MPQQTLLEHWVHKTAQSPAQENSSASSISVIAISRDNDDSAVAVKPTPRQLTTLHENVVLAKPGKEDIPRLKRLNSLLLPVPYPESFYRELQSDPQAQSLTLLAFWKDKSTIDAAPVHKGQLIGAVRCRLLESTGAHDGNGPILYLSTLVLLSPYRGLGIATYMLNTLIRRGVQDHGVDRIGAHVWDANTAALDWYQKRGFKEVGHDPDYYRKLEPHGAKIMSRHLSVLDLVDR